jgi:hypothetical protein
MNGLPDIRDYVSGEFLSLLPKALMAFLVTGILVSIMLDLYPQIQARTTIEAQVAQSEAAVDRGRGGSDDILVTLRRRITNHEAQLEEKSQLFLTDEQAAEVMRRMYGYAAESGVKIATLSAQAVPAEMQGTMYKVSAYQLEANGSVPELLEFLARIGEASLPSVLLTGVTVSQQAGEMPGMTMNIYLYTSDLAAGDALDDAPEIVIPTPVPNPTPTPVCDCSANTYDCRDFADQAAAQTCYEFCGGAENDIHLLDEDGDGVTCETVWP